MKKLIAVAVLALTAVSGWAQGTIDFRNGGVTFPGQAGIDRLVRGLSGTPLVGPNWAAGLYYMAGADAPIDVTRPGAAPDLGTQAGALAAFRVATTASPGLWLNQAAVGNNRILEGVPIGATATIQIRVWDTAQFTSFGAAHAAGIFGASVPFNYTVPAAGSAPDAYYLTALRGFTVVPEPGTIALAVLGLGSLLLFRRRK